MIEVITAKTIATIDGLNNVLLDSFNRLYCLESLTLVEKRRHFNTIISNFEPFLKKLYYIQNDKEMVSGKDEQSLPTFIDCILSFQCLRGLKYNKDERYQKFYEYLELVKAWRNDTAHAAPDATLEELKTSIHIVSTMYYFVIAQSLKR